MGSRSVTGLAEVRLWGRTIGAAAMAPGESVASFEYDPAFVHSGIQVAPLMMPLAAGVYRFPQLSTQAFCGLPGLLADSLPDRFGEALIDAWLATEGRPADSLNAVERLCFTGARGMGALEFVPALGLGQGLSTKIQVDQLVELASELLTRQTTRQASLFVEGNSAALQDFLSIGTSAGGARAKALIAWNPKTDEIRSGQLGVAPGFEHWLLKLDGVSGSREQELASPPGAGLIEYAYHLMALDCGIDMSECRLLQANGRSHFMTRRFDRLAHGEKLHMQSLAALAHLDFNQAGAYSYEQALMVMRRLGLPMRDIEQLFRRMVFNIVARNQHDHVKNIAFLMNKSGQWSLAPAFDLSFSAQAAELAGAGHQMSMNGKRADFRLDDFKACARTASLKRGRAQKILAEVQATVSNWANYARQAGVPSAARDHIQRMLNLNAYA